MQSHVTDKCIHHHADAPTYNANTLPRHIHPKWQTLLFERIHHHADAPTYNANTRPRHIHPKWQTLLFECIHHHVVESQGVSAHLGFGSPTFSTFSNFSLNPKSSFSETRKVAIPHESTFRKLVFYNSTFKTVTTTLNCARRPPSAVRRPPTAVQLRVVVTVLKVEW